MKNIEALIRWTPSSCAYPQQARWDGKTLTGRRRFVSLSKTGHPQGAVLAAVLGMNDEEGFFARGLSRLASDQQAASDAQFRARSVMACRDGPSAGPGSSLARQSVGKVLSAASR